MKKHSIRSKFLMTVISAMLAITVFIGGLSIYEVDNFVQLQTENLINTTCKKEASAIDEIFKDMEKSVRIMESYVLDLLKGEADVRNADKQEEIIDNTVRMFTEVAKNTDSTISFYLRFAPEISHEKSGLFYTKMAGSDEYVYAEPTDLSIYDRNDTEHVGWFWQPYEAEKPVWMHPYYNKNSNAWMISYVVPLYYENQFIGVVGMDFDYTLLKDKVQKIRFYEHGFAYLELEGTVIVGNEYIENYGDEMSEKYLQVSEKLVNGMTFVLSASYDDIRQVRYSIAFKIIFVVLLLAALFSIVVIIVVRRIVNPLTKLTEAAKKLTEGNYDIELAHSDTYEIKLLNTAVENMIVNLREHEELQHFMAYHDSLTGLRNVASYKEYVAEFDKKITEKDAEFAVVVCDINYLKNTNDRYGHDAGDKLIITASQVITEVFGESPVFRIGGDEFLTILQKDDMNNVEALLAEIDSESAEKTFREEDDDIHVSIAKGFARYDSAVDTRFADVFNRADEAMYENKRKMKELGK